LIFSPFAGRPQMSTSRLSCGFYEKSLFNLKTPHADFPPGIILFRDLRHILRLLFNLCHPVSPRSSLFCLSTCQSSEGLTTSFVVTREPIRNHTPLCSFPSLPPSTVYWSRCSAMVSVCLLSFPFGNYFYSYFFQGNRIEVTDKQVFPFLPLSSILWKSRVFSSA